MAGTKLFGLGLGALSVVTMAALTLPAAPAQADSFAFGFSSGGYHPRHHHRHHHYGARYVYVAPPPVYYYPPPPRVVYVNPPPPPVYYSVPPVVAPVQSLPGGPLAVSQQQHCREYQSTATVDGRQIPTYGTACQQADGSWRIVR